MFIFAQARYNVSIRISATWNFQGVIRGSLAPGSVDPVTSVSHHAPIWQFAQLCCSLKHHSAFDMAWNLSSDLDFFFPQMMHKTQRASLSSAVFSFGINTSDDLLPSQTVPVHRKQMISHFSLVGVCVLAVNKMPRAASLHLWAEQKINTQVFFAFPHQIICFFVSG